MKLWGGRFETGPSEVFEQFSGSLHFDGKLIFADVQGSPSAECDQIVAAFDAIAHEALNPDYLRGATDEDVHTFVIRQLQAKAGALAGKIHSLR